MRLPILQVYNEASSNVYGKHTPRIVDSLAPNYLFRVVLVNIVLFFDFINIFSTFYIFTYLITF